MELWLGWSLRLFVVGRLVTAAEVVMPSGGLLSIVAFICYGGSLLCAYQLSGMAALILAAVEGVCIPIVIIAAFKVLPKTALGRQLILDPPGKENPGGTGDPGRSTPPSREDREEPLLGKQGVVVTMLRPSGTAEFEGRRLSVVSDGESVPVGTKVQIVLVEGGRIVVEPIRASSP